MGQKNDKQSIAAQSLAVSLTAHSQDAVRVINKKGRIQVTTSEGMDRRYFNRKLSGNPTDRYRSRSE